MPWFSHWSCGHVLACQRNLADSGICSCCVLVVVLQCDPRYVKILVTSCLAWTDPILTRNGFPNLSHTPHCVANWVKPKGNFEVIPPQQPCLFPPLTTFFVDIRFIFILRQCPFIVSLASGNCRRTAASFSPTYDRQWSLAMAFNQVRCVGNPSAA